MKFKIQVENNLPFKDEIEIDLSKIFNSKQMKLIKNEIDSWIENYSLNECSVSEFLSIIILDKCRDYAND